jgi:hypothetical protein
MGDREQGIRRRKEKWLRSRQEGKPQRLPKGRTDRWAGAKAFANIEPLAITVLEETM